MPASLVKGTLTMLSDEQCPIPCAPRPEVLSKLNRQIIYNRRRCCRAPRADRDPLKAIFATINFDLLFL